MTDDTNDLDKAIKDMSVDPGTGEGSKTVIIDAPTIKVNGVVIPLPCDEMNLCDKKPAESHEELMTSMEWTYPRTSRQQMKRITPPPKYTLSINSRARLVGVLPSIVHAIQNALADPECPYDFGIPADGGVRTMERQQELFAVGRRGSRKDEEPITWCDGVQSTSEHQPKVDGFGYAVDFFGYTEKGVATWDLKYLEPIAKHIQKHCYHLGFIMDWGYDLWGKDGAHLQWYCSTDEAEGV